MLCSCVTASIGTVCLEIVEVVFNAKQSGDEQLNFLVSGGNCCWRKKAK